MEDPYKRVVAAVVAQASSEERPTASSSAFAAAYGGTGQPKGNRDGLVTVEIPSLGISISRIIPKTEIDFAQFPEIPIVNALSLVAGDISEFLELHRGDRE